MIANCHHSRASNRMAMHRRAGFTLIELLVVIVIIGIIVSLAAAAYVNTMRTARVSATESMLQSVHDALSDRLESYFATTRGAGAPPPHPASTALADNVRRRAEVIDRIEGMRAAFPQELNEFIVVNAGNNDRPNQQPLDPGEAYRLSGPIASYRNAVVEIINSREDPDSPGMYRLGETVGDGAATASEFVDAQTYKQALLENQSAECLYLILKHYGREAMSFTVDDIPSRFIRDTDGDGLLEIVDAWGNPVRFYRWPTDLYAYYIEVEGTLPEQLMVTGNPDRFIGESNIDPDRTLLEETWSQVTAADERGRAAFENVDRIDNLDDAFQIPPGGTNALRPRFAYFRLHGAYANPNAIIPEQGPTDPTDPLNRRLYPVAPVVVSAGPDGEFGMYLEPSGTAAEPTDLSVRCGRIDCTSDETLGQFLDNIVSIRVRSGANQ